jgi:hypothetical protein
LPFCRGVPLTLKAQKPKDYPDTPQTLGQHLQKRRRELGLLQREAAERMTVSVDTLINWEKSRTEPMPSQFRPVLAFLGYDPTPAPMTLPEWLLTKRRATGMTLADVARNLSWDEGTLTRYLDGHGECRPPERRRSNPSVGHHFGTGPYLPPASAFTDNENLGRRCPA